VGPKVTGMGRVIAYSGTSAGASSKACKASEVKRTNWMRLNNRKLAHARAQRWACDAL